MQIQLEKTLDVEVVERQLAELWKQTSSGAAPEDDFAVLRARVANLLVYTADASVLTEVNGVVAELTAMHPSRVLLMLGEEHAADHDIEMQVETFCQQDKRTGAKRLCCEEVTLKAAGAFVSELPSAALPLAIPDLTTFLWWRAELKSDTVFDALLRASDRLVVDSADFADPASDLLALTEFFKIQHYAHVGISDLNWARLTSWRALLAGFYDVPAYQLLLERIDKVRIDYLASGPLPESRHDACGPSEVAIAPQALLIAGWLASRLGWTLATNQTPPDNYITNLFNFVPKDRGSGPTVREGGEARPVKLELNRVERADGKPGRLVNIELQSSSAPPASFAVSRSADNLHLASEARVNRKVQRGRVLPVRNRSAAQLLGREMEILCNDGIYQEALAMAATMMAFLSEAP